LYCTFVLFFFGIIGKKLDSILLSVKKRKRDRVDLPPRASIEQAHYPLAGSIYQIGMYKNQKNLHVYVMKLKM